jgi:hypothetical protein
VAAFWFLVGSLAVFRVTHLLAAEDGPWQLLLRLRLWLGAGVLGALLDCFYCLSLWVAAPFAWALGHTWPERLMLWPALSGAAILLQRASARPDPPAPHD